MTQLGHATYTDRGTYNILADCWVPRADGRASGSIRVIFFLIRVMNQLISKPNMQCSCDVRMLQPANGQRPIFARRCRWGYSRFAAQA